MSADIGFLLKRLREAANLSQLELGLRLGVSQRHISFVEVGRARPSRQLIENWARETEAPTTLHNAALHQAGYAPVESELSLNDPKLVLGIEALTRMLTMHEPFAGVVFDADWYSRIVNASGLWLIEQLMPSFIGSAIAPDIGLDMIEALTHDAGLLSNMRDPWCGGGALLDQLRAEQWVRPSLAPRVDALEDSMLRAFSVHSGSYPHDLK